MSANDMEHPREDERSDKDEPIFSNEEGAPQDDNDEIIDLTEEVPADTKEDDEVIDLVEVLEDDDTDGGTTADDTRISPAQLEKALEKTVEKIYGDRIENLLIEAVQKKVSAEIEKIKNTLKSV